MAPCSPCSRKTYHLLRQDRKSQQQRMSLFLPAAWWLWWTDQGIIIKLSKGPNVDQSHIKEGKLNSAGAKISHICISAFHVLCQVLVRIFICQYEDDPTWTKPQAEHLLYYDPWQMLSHLVDYRWDRKKSSNWQSTSDLLFCTKNRGPFLVYKELMASLYLILLKLPWRNAITWNRGATGADIDGLCR